MRLLRRQRRDQWTAQEITSLQAAARLAPVMGRERPWELEFRGQEVELYETPPRYRSDGDEWDAILSCGAALANLRLVMRCAGWEVLAALDPDRENPDRLAVLYRAGHREPLADELIASRLLTTAWDMTHDFEPAEVTHAELADIGVGSWPSAEIRPLRSRVEAFAVAELMLYATRRLDGESRCAGELAAWIRQDAPARPMVSVPAQRGATPVAADSCLAEPYRDAVCAIAARLVAEPVLVVLTMDDARRDRMLAGAAIQEARLAAARNGLAIAAITRPLQVPEVRCALIEKLELPGFPQALLRVGHGVRR